MYSQYYLLINKLSAKNAAKSTETSDIHMIQITSANKTKVLATVKYDEESQNPPSENSPGKVDLIKKSLYGW